MPWTPDELAAMAAADAEIEETFALSEEDRQASLDQDDEIKAQRLGITVGKLRERREKARLYQAGRREQVHAADKAYRETHKKEIAAQKHRWYLENKERILAHNRAAYRARKEAAAHVQN